jgi:hypothetical protein
VEICVSSILELVAVVASVLGSYVMLAKVGVPWFFAAPLALLVGYLVYRWENADADGEPKWVSALSSLKDLKDIGKYVNQIF